MFSKTVERTFVILVWLLADATFAQWYPRNTMLNGNFTTNAKPTKSASSSNSVTSFFSVSPGPFLAITTYTWSRYLFPVTVGTVYFTINEVTNETSSRTVYHTDYERNGSITLLTRNDTNAAGTVTKSVGDSIVTYPTNYFEANSSLLWGAILATTRPTEQATNVLHTPTDTGSCCSLSILISPTPTHTPFVEVGTLDTQDPQGWLYSLHDARDAGLQVLSYDEVSSLWPSQIPSFDYTGCSYTWCDPVSYSSTAEGLTAVGTQSGFILASTTETISSSPAGSTTSSNLISSSSIASSIASIKQAASIQSSSVRSTSTSATPVSSSTFQSTATSTTLSETIEVQTTQASVSRALVPPDSSFTLQSTVPSTTLSGTVEVQTTQITQSPGSKTLVRPDSRSTFKSTATSSTQSETIKGSTSTSASPDLGSSFQSTVTSTTLPETIDVQTNQSPASNADNALVIGGSTASTLPADHINIPPTITNSLPFVAESDTVLPGSTIIVGSGTSATTIAIQPSGSSIIVIIDDSITSTLPAETLPSLTIGDAIITADPSSEYIISGQTLVPGSSAITVDGTTISLASQGSQLIEGTSTVVIENTGLGGIIMSFLGGAATSTSTASPESQESTVAAGSFLGGGATATASSTSIASTASQESTVAAGNTGAFNSTSTSIVQVSGVMRHGPVLGVMAVLGTLCFVVII